MPLDLPPGLPPHMGDAVILEKRVSTDRGNMIELQVGGETIRLAGNTYLSEELIQKSASAVKLPAQFILLLNALYAATGYPLVNVQYARDKESGIIYLYVDEGYLVSVQGSEALVPFFKDFEGRRDLKIGDFEAKRVLAQIKADRAGYIVSSEYKLESVAPNAFTLALDAEPDPEHNRVSASTVFGNPGNRFLGRYFGIGNVRVNTSGGQVFGLSYTKAATDLGETRGGESYDSIGLNFSGINTTGLYNVSASYTHYEIGNRFGFQETEDAEIIKAGIEGTQFLYASRKTRWLLTERLEYTVSETEFTDTPVSTTLADGTIFPVEGQLSRDERYASFRLGSSLTRSWRLFGQPGSVTLGGNYKRGFAGDINNVVNTQASSDFNILTGQFKLSYRMFLSLVASLSLEGQQSIDQEVPQQEQWVLGGPNRLSAYLPGVLVGDNGAYGRFDLTLPPWKFFGLPEIRFGVFAEAGTAEYEIRRGSNAAVRAAADAGVKVDINPAGWLTVSAQTARTLGERNIDIFPGPEVLEDNEADFFFSVKAQF